MSRERARRRAEREAVAAAEREQRERSARRRRRLDVVGRAVLAPLRLVAMPVRTAGAAIDGSARGRTALGRSRRREDGVLLAVLLAVHAILWLFVPSWWVRGSALVLTALMWPVLTVFFFDRRPTR